ncbi:hypothetical protein FAM18110_02926 [Lacticaseibacillus paracasei]|jgi:hypothetical protein|nr:hypothetical protein FAM18110_02926 [Lacticaseibacillus paracasei]
MIQMRTNDLVSLYVSFVETNGGKSRPVLIRKVSEQTIEAFKITSKYQNKSAYIKQQYYPIKDWQAAGLKKPSWVDLGNIYRFPKAGLNFKEIGHLRTCLVSAESGRIVENRLRSLSYQIIQAIFLERNLR